MAKRTCSIEGCNAFVVGRGWCSKHWQRWKKWGDPLMRTIEVGDAPARFFAKVNKTDTCWLWTGHVSVHGYGKFWADGLNLGAHRWSYQYHVGPIPEGLHLDHLCRVRNCVNPAHLEPVTCQENLRRGETLNAANLRKTHCPKGHPYDAENTYRYSDGRRACKECNRIHNRKLRQPA